VGISLQIRYLFERDDERPGLCGSLYFNFRLDDDAGAHPLTRYNLTHLLRDINQIYFERVRACRLYHLRIGRHGGEHTWAWNFN